jgi:hypothetical protein
MSTRHSKNDVCTRTMWKVITSTEMFRSSMSIERISSVSNVKEVILFLFKISVVLLIRCRIVNCSMFSDEKVVASWSINMSLNSRSSYLDAVKTLYVYDIEAMKVVMLFVETSLCLNVLSASMLMIVIIVFTSFNESTKMRNDSDSLFSSMTNSLDKALSIEMFSNDASVSMFNFSKNWAMKSSFWFSFHSTINCFKRRWNSWRDFHLELRFAKRFF